MTRYRKDMLLNLPFKRKPTELDLAITQLYDLMGLCEPDSEEYKTLLEHVVKLEGLKNTQRSRALSRDTEFSGVVSLLGIGFIVSYEHLHVIASKAVGFVPKPKQ